MKFPAILSLLTVGILCQGCFVFPYPTPEIKGSVVDGINKEPIANARIEVRKHPRISCETAADGSFDLPKDHIWGFCFLMPGDFLVFANLACTATNYQTFTNTYIQGWEAKSIVLQHPIELRKN